MQSIIEREATFENNSDMEVISGEVEPVSR